MNWFGRTFGRPSQDIVARRIHIEHGAGPTVGSETSGSVFNVTFEDFTLHGGEIGPTMKSAMGRGGSVRGVTWRNISGSDVGGVLKARLNMLQINLLYEGTRPPQNQSEIPDISDLLFEDVRFAKGPGFAASLQGLPERPVRNVVFRRVEFPEDAPFGPCSHVEGTCEDVNRCPSCFHQGHEGLAEAVVV